MILTASIAPHVGGIGGTVYTATKAAVRSLGRSFGAELAPRGIRVNTLTSGPIGAPLMAESGASVEVVAEMIRKMVPMGRIGTALAAASVALFLASFLASDESASDSVHHAVIFRM